MIRILLIDDEVRKAQALINYFVEVCEWSADMAPSPDRALELLQKNQACPYDVIILDVMMDPGNAISREASNGGRNTGLILLDAIVTLTHGRGCIIVYSARTDLDHLKDDSRVASYIQKPSSARDIAREIESLIGRPA